MRQLFRIVEREELDAFGADPGAPFALAAAPGFVIDDRSDPPDLQSNPGMSHGHHNDLADMNTGFIAKGAGIRAGACAPPLPRRRSRRSWRNCSISISTHPTVCCTRDC